MVRAFFVPIYGNGASGGVSIYTGINDTGIADVGALYGATRISACTFEDTCLTQTLMVKFYTIVENIQTIVEQLFPTISAKSSVIAKVRAYAYMNDFTFVRFIWINRHPGMIFDTNNLSLRYAIKDIYLEFKLSSWVTDALVALL
jgi:hypothetical protein